MSVYPDSDSLYVLPTVGRGVEGVGVGGPARREAPGARIREKKKRKNRPTPRRKFPNTSNCIACWRSRVMPHTTDNITMVGKTAVGQWWWSAMV